MKVTLQAINKNDGWAGTTRYKNCNDNLGPYFTRSGAVYTGLEKQYLEEGEENLREELEDVLQKNLHPNSDFWKTFTIRISEKGLLLDTGDPMDKLRYIHLRNHKRVQKSLNEPKATAYYVLINEHAEAEERNKFNKLKRKALSYFDRMSTQEIIKALRVFGYGADATSPEVAENKLNEVVERDPQAFLNRWVDNKHKDTEYYIKQAIAKNIIRRNKNIYKYGTDVIGHTLEDTINFLENKENSDIKVSILKEINAK